MTSTLATLRQHTSEQEGPAVIDAIRRAPRAAVDVLAERLLASPTVPVHEVAETEVWPLVNARSSLLSRGAQGFVDGVGPVGVSVTGAMDPRQIGHNTFSNSVIRALLYSHGLVVEDPVLMAAELYATGAAELRDVARQFLEAACVSLFEIDALLDDGIVETFFVPMADRAVESPVATKLGATLAKTDRDELWEAFEVGYIEGLTPALRSLWKKIRGGDRNPPLDLVDEALTETDVEVVKVFVDVVASVRPEAVLDNTMAIVSSAREDQQRLGCQHDILCASELFARLLFVGAPDPAAELRVRQLAQTPVPNIEQLDLRDVVAIRQNSEAFATWRSRLSLGLERAHRLRDELGPDVDVAAAIDEVMADAHERLSVEARRSSFLGNSGWISFIAGALGGAIAGSGGGTAASTLTGAGGGLLSEALRRAPGRASNMSAVHRHYVLFRRIR